MVPDSNFQVGGTSSSHSVKIKIEAAGATGTVVALDYLFVTIKSGPNNARLIPATCAASTNYLADRNPGFESSSSLTKWSWTTSSGTWTYTLPFDTTAAHSSNYRFSASLGGFSIGTSQAYLSQTAISMPIGTKVNCDAFYKIIRRGAANIQISMNGTPCYTANGPGADTAWTNSATKTPYTITSESNYIEIKLTSSRKTGKILDLGGAWLTPISGPSGEVCT